MSYFERAPRQATPDHVVSIWPFELGHYGMRIENFRPRPSQRISMHLHKWLSRKKIVRSYLYDGQQPRLAFIDKAIEAGKFTHLFPIHPETRNQLKSLIASHPRYGVAHIRRGDYLYVASHIVTEEQVIHLLQQMEVPVPVLFIASDGEINISAWQEALPEIDIRTFGANDAMLCHALMRHADVLITANSQFSYTAALLNDVSNAHIFVPKYWGSSITLAYLRKNLFYY